MALSPEKLAALDRKLTPDEQATVDAWQETQANAVQTKEEITPRVDQRSGVKTFAKVSFEPGAKKFPSGIPLDPYENSSTAMTATSRRPWWHYVLIAAGIVGVIGGGYGLYRAIRTRTI